MWQMLSLELELAFSCGQSVQFLRCLDRSNYPGSGQYLGCLRSPPGIQQLYAPSAFRRSPSERKHSHYCVENQMQFKNVFLGQEFLHLNQVYEIVIVKQAKSYTLSSHQSCSIFCATKKKQRNCIRGSFLNVLLILFFNVKSRES